MYAPIVHKSRDAIAQFGESGRQVQRYIRLTELIYQLLDKVDIKLISVTAGAEVSYLDVRNQVIINDVLDRECCGLSLNQAIKLKQHYLGGDISEEVIANIIAEKEQKDKGKVILQYDRLRKYFPEQYTPKEYQRRYSRCFQDIYKSISLSMGAYSSQKQADRLTGQIYARL